MTRLPRLCITSPWNYPLFEPENQTHFGGWEVRVALIAREIARRGQFKVSIVVADHGQPHVEHREGVTLYSWVGRDIWGIPSPKLARGASRELHILLQDQAGKLGVAFTSRIKKYLNRDGVSGQVGPYFITSGMTSIYDEVDADIYMVPGNSQLSGEAVFYARRRGRIYAFLAGSDMDFYPEYKLNPDKLDIYSVPFALKTYAIENADVLIVQNERQAGMLQAYGRSGVVIRNPIDLELKFPRNPAAGTILWVGKSDERVKRPSLMLELARQLPEYHFVLIMNFSIPETHAECLAAASRLPNVTLVEKVPFQQVEEYFANARLHLNTSIFEGFPNTFLQAAKYGVPTISLAVDPGGMFSSHGCGIVSDGNLVKMKENVRILMEDDDECARIGRRAQAYVRENHDKDVIIPEYERALLSVRSNH